ncbi:uncharacterized protein BO95DRAFT_445667 [Aspergillus brunneoviolaceus CBS 621.78]|uniref:Uncharacterized protein n=1 Tax=Aspergillus brunneoviolaceus CBS 621.78 TaxID=1450534 RepID=A0ACD1G0N1_9EURO|nr:hypothetical protein BO95DRAFT_445667 [Aspergillus brunneoviolaceus CBS 621.78]RAH42758.1 hypothetical protein BO95DRAFT_445667 [Aspergillus brunneoviolaceus CBS 621.78]
MNSPCSWILGRAAAAAAAAALAVCLGSTRHCGTAALHLDYSLGAFLCGQPP